MFFLDRFPWSPADDSASRTFPSQTYGCMIAAWRWPTRSHRLRER